MVGLLLLCLILVGIAGGVGYKFFYGSSLRVAPGDLITEVATTGPFDHIVLEQGEIESSSNQVVLCEVKARGSSQGGVAILWVIDEGARVKKGDKLVELDSSELELREKEQRISVITAEARLGNRHRPASTGEDLTPGVSRGGLQDRREDDHEREGDRRTGPAKGQVSDSE